MQVHFSRHAKRRTALYGISETEIQKPLQIGPYKQGYNELIVHLREIAFPVKVVFTLEDDGSISLPSCPISDSSCHQIPINPKNFALSSNHVHYFLCQVR